MELQSSIITTTHIKLVAVDLPSKSVRTYDEQSDCLPKPRIHQNSHPLSALMPVDEGEEEFALVMRVTFMR